MRVPLPVGRGPRRFFVITVRLFMKIVLSQKQTEGKRELPPRL